MSENGNVNNVTRRTSSEVWDRLNQQSDAISEIARAQAATEANLANLAKSVESGFNSINSNISRLVDRDSRPTNWFGLGSLVVVVLGALLTFVALQTDPVRLKAIENDERIDEAQVRELHDAEDRGHMKSDIEALQREVREIDQRHWIEHRK